MVFASACMTVWCLGASTMSGFALSSSSQRLCSPKGETVQFSLMPARPGGVVVVVWGCCVGMPDAPLCLYSALCVACLLWLERCRRGNHDECLAKALDGAETAQPNVSMVLCWRHLHPSLCCCNPVVVRPRHVQQVGWYACLRLPRNARSQTLFNWQ